MNFGAHVVTGHVLHSEDHFLGIRYHFARSPGIITWNGVFVPGGERLVWQLFLRHTTGMASLACVGLMVALILRNNLALGLLTGYVGFYLSQCWAALSILHNTGVYHSTARRMRTRILAIALPVALYLVLAPRPWDGTEVALSIASLATTIPLALFWNRIVGPRYDACCRGKSCT